MEKRDFYTEFQFRFSRSSGSGGQHVNKVETRVELLFNLHQSALLTEGEKSVLAKRWSNRLSKEGILRIANQESRSQLSNKEHAIIQFYELLAKGLKKQKKRKVTKPSAAAKAKRLADKKYKSDKKASRKKVNL